MVSRVAIEMEENGWQTGTWRRSDEQVGANYIAKHAKYTERYTQAKEQWPGGFRRSDE